MGEFYEIGLQTGKKVTENVDAFILAEHKDKDHNFDPADRRTLSNGSTIYRWYMKWQPYFFEDEKRFIKMLQQFDDDELENIPDDEIEDYAYKYVAVGDEGGQDEGGNEIGYEIFDSLYNANAVTFPESFNECKDIIEGYNNVVPDEAAQLMSDLLMDDTVTTCDMYESLCRAYINGNDDVRKGINRALEILTRYKLEDITKRLMEDEDSEEIRIDGEIMMPVTIFRDSTDLYTEDEIEEDNLITVEVPSAIIVDYFREYILDNTPYCDIKQCEEVAKKDPTFDEWYNSYTADETTDLYRFAKERGYTITREGCAA